MAPATVPDLKARLSEPPDARFLPLPFSEEGRGLG